MRGQVVSVYDRPERTYLESDLAIGATAIPVYDAPLYFSSDGGFALISDDGDTGLSEVVTYGGYDADTDTLTGVSALVNAYTADTTTITPLLSADPTSIAATTRYAEVREIDEDDTVQVRIPHFLYSLVDTGIRDENANETFDVTFDNDQSDVGDWVMTDVLGKVPSIDGGTIDFTGVSIPTSDGIVPASSPTPTVTVPYQGKELLITWPEISNADPVTYDVYRSTVNGFTPPGVGTLIGSARGTQMIASGLTGGTTYYFVIIARDADGSGPPGAQGSGVPKAFTSDGNAPSSSPTPTVLGGPQLLLVRWTEISNPDPVTYKVFVRAGSAPTTADDTYLAASVSGNSVVITRDATGAALTSGTTYHVEVVAKDSDGSAAASADVTGTTTTLPTTFLSSDGVAPASSPTPTLTGAFGLLAARWTPITNADLVTYNVHLSTTTGFTPGAGTLAGQTAGGSFVFRTDPGTSAALVEGTTYYCKIVATDADGSAAASSQASAVMTKVDGTTDVVANSVTAASIAANTITAAQIAAGTITANEIAANTITAAKIAANTITAAQIAAGTITATEIAAGTITATQLTAGIVYAGIVDGTTITGANFVADGTSGDVLVYQGTPALNNLIMSISPVSGSDAYGNAYPQGVQIGAAGDTQVTIVPDSMIVFGTGTIQATIEASTTDVNELLPGFVGSVLFNQGAANQQMASLVTSPVAAANGYGIVVQADADDVSSTAGALFGTITTDGLSETFSELARIGSQGRFSGLATLAYSGQGSRQTSTWTVGGGHTWTAPAGVTQVTVEAWGAGGGGFTSSSTGAAGAGGGEYSKDVVAVTPGHAYTVTVGFGGGAGSPGVDGGDSSFVGDASATVTGHGGKRATGSNTPGAGGTGSLAATHHDGGAGGAAHNVTGVIWQDGDGGSSAGTQAAGNAGGHTQVNNPAPTGGGFGAGGGSLTANANGVGGQPGGGGAGGKIGSQGGAGQVRLTFAPSTTPLIASMAAASGTDLFGNTYPEGFMGDALQLTSRSVPSSPNGAAILFSQSSGTAGQPSWVNPQGFSGVIPGFATGPTTTISATNTGSAVNLVTFTIPANDIAGGVQHMIIATGIYGATNTPPTLTWDLIYGTTSLMSGGFSPAIATGLSAGGFAWRAIALLNWVSATECLAQLEVMLSAGATVASNSFTRSHDTSGLVTTSQKDLTLTVTWGTPSSTNSITRYGSYKARLS